MHVPYGPKYGAISDKVQGCTLERRSVVQWSQETASIDAEKALESRETRDRQSNTKYLHVREVWSATCHAWVKQECEVHHTDQAPCDKKKQGFTTVSGHRSLYCCCSCSGCSCCGRCCCQANGIKWAIEAGSSSISDGGGSDEGILTPADSARLHLINLELSIVPIKDAGSDITSALNNTRIHVNNVTDKSEKSTVASVTQSLKGIGKYADQGYVIVYHPHCEWVSVNQMEDVNIDWSRLPV